jgi:hypothetical protein
MISPAELARHYYRMGLGAAKRRDLSAASAYAGFACLLDAEHGGASRLAEICRDELEGAEETPEAFDRIGLLAGQKKWKAAALAAERIPYQSVRILNIRGCLLALAKRYAPAADCFAKALVKDRGNVLAAEALACLGRRRNHLWGFFVPL